MEPNIRAATTAAGINEAARAAKEENGDFGYLVRFDGDQAGETYRRATAEDAERANKAAIVALDPDAPFSVDDGVKVTLRQLP